MVRWFRTIIKVGLITLTVSLTLISTIGGMSTFMILSAQDNIDFGLPGHDVEIDGYANSFEINYNGTENYLNASVPFRINNVGAYPFTNFTLGVIVTAYSQTNTTVEELIRGSQTWLEIPARSDFNDTMFLEKSDVYNIGSPLNWQINVTISVTSQYSLSFISFDIQIEQEISV